MVEHHDECGLCKGGSSSKGRMAGGSLASDAVTNLIGCDTWDALNAMQTNVIPSAASAVALGSFGEYIDVTQEGGKTGGKCRRRRLINRASSRARKQKGGSGACDSQPLDVLQPYMGLNPATVPLTAPLEAADSINWNEVPPSTTLTMGAPLGLLNVMDTHVTIPNLPNMTTTGP